VPATGSTRPPPAPAALAASSPAWVVALAEGQALLAEGRAKEATEAFERAAEPGDRPAARAILDHARTALASRGACSLVAIGRPRPVDSATAARHAAVGASGERTIVLLVAEARDSGQPHAYSVALDAAMRAVSVPVDVTREAASVASARMEAGASGLALAYGEASGSAPGAYVRALDAEGRSTSAPTRVAEGRPSASRVELARAPGGDWWLAFAHEPEGDRSSAFVRKLGADLSPAQPPVRATRPAGARGALGSRALAPAVAVAGPRLVVAFRSDGATEHGIDLLRVALDDPRLSSPAATERDAKGPGPVLLGQATRVTAAAVRVRAPELSCDATGCLVAWRTEPTGAQLARVDLATGDVRWRRMLGAQGKEPSVRVGASGRALVAWYEDARLRVAPISEAGLGASAAIGCVAGEQPGPSIAALGAGSWAVAWTSFEGGRPEVYVARVACEP
jgi:hypothetical protein